jgi:hypothetical protein
MNLYAVIDADGFVLETWESPFEPQQPRTRQRGERLVKKTPNATGWVVVEGTCRRGDRLAVDEHGCGRLAMEGNAQTYSRFFFKLEELAAEAEDANYHPLARVLDQVRLLFSVGEIKTAERLLQGPADEVRQAIRTEEETPAVPGEDRGPSPLTPPADPP